jgi:hypothetical protein
MDQIQGVTQDTSGTNCKSPFTLASKESYVLKLNITQAVFGGPVICEQVPNCPNCHLECYQPSPNALLNISQGSAVAIGDSYGGGYVACLNGGLNNLITANANNGQADWGSTIIQTNAISTTDGAANTIAIVNALGAGNYAAKICADYEIDSQGNTPCQPSNTCYNDWFLSAKDQLNCLYTNKLNIPGFANAGYWSSTESAIDGAWFQNFATGTQSTALKSIANLQVRCIRSFSP